jgi:hypothetical protein
MVSLLWTLNCEEPYLMEIVRRLFFQVLRLCFLEESHKFLSQGIQYPAESRITDIPKIMQIS